MKSKTVFIIFEALNCTPNGDPDTGEQRFNDVTQKAIVSDLRIKRYGRDKLNSVGKNVFYFFDKENVDKYKVEGSDAVSGASARFSAFCKEHGYDEPKTSSEAKEMLLKEFVDARIFGTVLTHKTTKANISGSLQFNSESESINVVKHGKNLVNRAITTVFPSKDTKGQGSIGRDTFIRYGLFCIRGQFSAEVARLNGASDDDLDLMLTAIWNEIETINTRSKSGQTPLAMIVIEHPTKKLENGCLLSRQFNKSFSPFNIIPKTDISQIYSSDDYEFDFSPLNSIMNEDIVESVTIYCDDKAFSDKHFIESEKCKFENPFDKLISLL